MTEQKKDVIRVSKKKFYEILDKKTGILSNVGGTEYSVPFSRIPAESWKEWDKECQICYNGQRWLKAWSDHLKAKSYDTLTNVAIQSVNVQKEEDKEEKKDDAPLTFGDGGK
jgi:hypothetical protein